MADKSDKTEKPTPRKLTEVSKDGSVARSPDLTAWIGILALAYVAHATLGNAFDVAGQAVLRLPGVAASPDPGAVVGLLRDALVATAWACVPLFAGLFVLALVSGVAQGRARPYGRRIKPSWKKFNPKNYVKRVFGKQGLWELTKILLKSAIVGWFGYRAVMEIMPILLGSGRLPLTVVLKTVGDAMFALVRDAAIAALILSFADYGVSWRRVRTEAKMSRKELMDEFKQSEGDPQLKATLRSRAQALSRNRMMAEIATADVVLVNPTHIAVALRYTPGAGAPRVVAKGAGPLATRIRSIAAENRVPVVQDVMLARTLYKVCDIGTEIPRDLYAAVARVLAFVMGLKRRGTSAGYHTEGAVAALSAVRRR